MRRPGPLAVVAMAAALWAAVWLAWVVVRVPAETEAARGVHVAEGYLASVDLFLRHDWLVFDTATETVVLADDLEGTAAEEFYRDSYLENDVAAFNDGDRSVFRVENGRVVALDPTRHNVALPFTETRSWKGELSFRPEGGRRAQLTGGGAAIELIEPTAPLAAQHALPEVVVRQEGAAGGAERRVHGEAVNVFGQGGVFFGKTHLAGDGVIFNNRDLGGGVGISISGEPVVRGNRSRLDSGDLLKLRWRVGRGEGRYALLWTSLLGESPVISSWRSLNGRWQRTPERPEPPLAADVVAALDGAFRQRDREGRYRVPERGERDRVDVALTLDARLQEEVQRRLARFAQGLRGRREPPFRAAVTVMDATTGELLALASFPTADDLEELPTGGAARRRLTRNHNLARLPIGSVAKVPLAAAIVDQAPFLTGLTIPGYAGGEIEDILGLAIDPVLRDHAVWGGDDGQVDFDEFIEQSSNKYATVLLTLAAAVDDAGTGLLPPEAAPAAPDALAEGSRFAVGGTPWTRRPELRLPVEASRGPEGEPRAEVGTITTLEHLAYARRLDPLFDVPASRKSPTSDEGEPELRRAPGEGDDLIDTAPWLPLLAHLYGGREDIPRDHPFYGVSPERANLAYNLIHDYRREYLSVVLGGGTSTWTMPQVATVFSRLVTGRQVRPTMVRRLTTARGETIESDAEPPPLPMNPSVRRRLMQATTRVVGPAGTARALHGRLATLDRRLGASGEALGVFAKTGSPDNTIFFPSRTARALDELIRTGALRLDDRGRVVYRNTGPVDADAIDGPEARRTLNALEAHPGDRDVMRRWGVRPRTVVQVADTWNDSLPEDRDQFEVVGGKLVRANNLSKIDAIGAAFVITLAAYDMAARQGTVGGLPAIDVAGHRPKRALTVAMVIEGQGDSGDVAVPFAATLLDEVLADALVAGW